MKRYEYEALLNDLKVFLEGQEFDIDPQEVLQKIEQLEEEYE